MITSVIPKETVVTYESETGTEVTLSEDKIETDDVCFYDEIKKHGSLHSLREENNEISNVYSYNEVKKHGSLHSLREENNEINDVYSYNEVKKHGSLHSLREENNEINDVYSYSEIKKYGSLHSLRGIAEEVGPKESEEQKEKNGEECEINVYNIEERYCEKLRETNDFPSKLNKFKALHHLGNTTGNILNKGDSSKPNSYFNYARSSSFRASSSNVLNKARLALSRANSLHSPHVVNSLEVVTEKEEQKVPCDSSESVVAFQKAEKYENYRNSKIKVEPKEKKHGDKNGKDKSKVDKKSLKHRISPNKVDKTPKRRKKAEENSKCSCSTTQIKKTSPPETLPSCLPFSTEFEHSTSCPKRFKGHFKNSYGKTKTVSFECDLRTDIFKAEKIETNTADLELNGFYGGQCESQKLLMPMILEDYTDYIPPAKEEEDLLPKLICSVLAICLTIGIVYAFTFIVTRMNINLFGST